MSSSGKSEISNTKTSKKRDQFTSNTGFIISSVGAALGLGNIWMFPYKLGKYGGAAFLIPYFLFVFLLGVTGLITEFSFGRKFRTGSFQGIKTLFDEKGKKGSNFIRAIPTIGMVGTFMFYSIVIGWILKYFFLSITGGINSIDTPTFFDSFSGTTQVIPWFFLSIILTVSIILFGVSKGIEKLNKIVMPLLLIIFIAIMIKSLSLPGAMEGVKYLVYPRWEYLKNVETWVMALGQAYFTVSLTGCGLVVYGSYSRNSYDIPKSAMVTAIFDTIAAILAAFMIIPAVFALNLDITAGPALLFITVPKVFQSMPFGAALSSLFFLSIIFAAISSSINMLEGPVEALMSLSKMTRKKAAYILGILSFVVAIPLAVNINLFDNFTNLMTIIVAPIGTLIVSVCFFYLLSKKEILEEVNKSSKIKLGNGFIAFGKYVFVITTIVIIILGIKYGGIG